MLRIQPPAVSTCLSSGECNKGWHDDETRFQYHPFFLMQGLPTHYHRREDSEAVTIQSYVDLFSEHFEAARKAGLALAEFRECVIDEQWLSTKPKWRASSTGL